MKKKLFLGILGCLFFSVAHAQIGYQVALLNSATGKPRANETVSANVVITDSNNGTVCSETKTVTSNDFGILSFSVGNANTFKYLGIRKLPLYISVSVDGVLIGKSQILSVPVAEVANTLKSDFTLNELCKTWELYKDSWNEVSYTFGMDGTVLYKIHYNDEEDKIFKGTFEIVGNTIYVYFEAVGRNGSYYFNSHGNGNGCICVVRWHNGAFNFSELPVYRGK